MHYKSYQYVCFETTYDCSIVWLYDVGKILILMFTITASNVASDLY
jgi:hypothetical protein